MTKSEILNALKELETHYEAAYQAWLNDKGCASPLRFQDDLAQNEQKYFYATGGDLKLTAEDWLNYYESLGEAKPVEITASEMLEKEPVKLKIEKIRTKNGNTYTKVVNVDWRCAAHS